MDGTSDTNDTPRKATPASDGYLIRLSPDQRGGWRVYTPRLGAATPAKSIEAGLRAARAALAKALAIKPSQVRTRVQYNFGQDTAWEVIQLDHAREHKSKDYENRLDDAIFHLRIDGVSAEDIAVVTQSDIKRVRIGMAKPA